MQNIPVVQPPSRPSPGTTSPWISWIVIVLSVATIVAVPVLQRAQREAAFQKQSLNKPDVQLLLTSRYLVGVERAMPMKPADTKELGSTALKRIDVQASTPMDKLRAAIVHGELEGKDSALRHLERLQARPEVRTDAATLRELYTSGTVDAESAAWKDFHQRHAWFADLALSNGRPETDPLRASVLNHSLQTVIVMMIMVIGGLAAATIGLILFIVWIVYAAQGKWRFAFPTIRPLSADRRSYLEAFAVYLGGYVGLSLLLRYGLQVGGLWVAMALPVPLIVALLWPRLRGQSWAAWRGTVGLHTGRGVFTEMACGAVGYLAGLPVFGAGILMTLVLSKLSGANPTHPIVQELSSDVGTVVMLLMLASVWAPITEELMFRGALFGHLRGRLGWWPSSLLVSLIFAGIHPQGWAAIPALGSLAMVLAAIREWRGSIVGCMTAHAINNTLLIIATVLMLS